MARNFKGKTFTKILRGYAPEEVEGYIAYIDEEYKKLERTSGDNMRKLALALRKLDEMNNYAEELEKQLDEQSLQYEEQIAKQKQQIIVLAKHLQKRESATASSTEAVEKAKKDAEMIVSDAQLQGEKIIAEAEELARSVREKILTEAAARAERIILEAEESVKGTQNAAQDMSVAAVDIYNEICAFRDTLFAAYNTHIESIEEITAAAEVLLADTNVTADADAEAEEGLDAAMEEYEEIGEEDIPDADKIIAAALELEQLEELEGLEQLEEFDELDDGEVQPDEEILAAYDTLVADEADFQIVDESADFYTVENREDDGIVIDENGFIILADEEKEKAEEYEVFTPEEEIPFDIADEDEFAIVDEVAEEAEVPADVLVDVSEYEPANEIINEDFDEDDDFEAVEDTYESYETYGEIDEEELDDTIEDLAQKYSQVYTDNLDEDDFEDDFEEEFEEADDGSYAPDAEFAWGDDMYAEPDDAVDEEEFEDIFTVDEVPEEELADEDKVIDELDRLKQFFSADYDDSPATNKAYDTASNSTTSIALSLNDFFEEGETPYEDDFEFDVDGDMDSLFEKEDDPLSVTDEFNIIFGKMDSVQNVEEISRQPIIPAEEPKNPKKHKKF